MFKKCSICGKSSTFLKGSVELLDGNVCKDCLRKSGLNEIQAKSMYVAEFSKHIQAVPVVPTTISRSDIRKANRKEKEQKRLKARNDAKQERIAQKEEYQTILANMKSHDAVSIEKLLFDDTTSKMLIKKSLLTPYRLVDYSEIVGFRENVQGSQKSKHHRITRGAVGGVLLGGPGMVIGALTGGKDFQVVNHLGVVITFSDGTNYEAKIINSETKTQGFIYNGLIKIEQQLQSKLQSIIDQPKQIDTQTQGSTTNFEQEKRELLELKELVDAGVITEEEFQLKKKKVLGI
ncbi:SHOCT domain-containing protein [Companilactobacillus sp.]|uniref:SHOCT domain-containing protein n=1 Tax=Companilactobacillus sp. TaxID=2767905 RepID=UPI002606F327|nr:SHOCT domain-containing protein [Companilactobacillus sp.]